MITFYLMLTHTSIDIFLSAAQAGVHFPGGSAFFGTGRSGARSRRWPGPEPSRKWKFPLEMEISGNSVEFPTSIFYFLEKDLPYLRSIFSAPAARQGRLPAGGVARTPPAGRFSHAARAPGAHSLLDFIYLPGLRVPRRARRDSPVVRR